MRRVRWRLRQRIASLVLLPSARLRAMGSLVSAWQRMRVTAIRWIVALIWRLPPRSSRWRLVLPELTGIGAMPAARASLASEENRFARAISPTSLAAVSGLGERGAAQSGRPGR